MKKTICRGDIFIVIGVIMLSLLLLFLTNRFSEKRGESVKISYPGVTEEYPLSDDERINIESDGYSIVFVIENGGVRVESSDCPDKICQKTGIISKTGERIVCLPARVYAEIIGEENEVIVAG